MKINKRLTLKGQILYDEKKFVTFDKELGEQEYSFDEIFAEFDNLEDVSIAISHDTIIEAQ